MFGLKRIQGVITAVLPVHHGGNENTGAIRTLNRLKTYTANGDIAEIPYLSGNGIRGYLRRLIMQDFFAMLDYPLDVSKGRGLQLYHCFFSGGQLQSVDSSAAGAIDLHLKRDIVSLLPPVALLGFAIGNQMIPSKLKVLHGFPVCAELAHMMPDGLMTETSFYDQLGHVFKTRRDDLGSSDDTEQPVQMILEYEVFIPGTKFIHSFMVEDPDDDDVDLSCLARMIELWEEKPFIGGQSGTGFGQVNLAYDAELESDTYIEFVHKHKDDIRQVLEQL